MSRVALIEQLTAPKKKSALEFNYDALWAPPIKCLISQDDINQLYKIATSLRYNDDIEKKYELIDAVMRPRGFKRGNRGTNRVVYNFLEDRRFCFKIALDRVGIKDSPAEFRNQQFFKPFCCKIFEVDPTGVVACIERVNPISSLEEFASIADDVFNMMVTKIIGKYVVDDLGTEKFMNYGIRYNSNGVAFGPVVIDFPYAYELDGAKLHCARQIRVGNTTTICNGEIDYDSGLNHLVCNKCGAKYTAKELGKDDSNIIKYYSDEDGNYKRLKRVMIIRGSDGTIVKDSGRSSKLYISKEEYEEATRIMCRDYVGPRKVAKTVHKKYVPIRKQKEKIITELQIEAYEKAVKQQQEQELFNPVIRLEENTPIAKKAKRVNAVSVYRDMVNDNTAEELYKESLGPRAAKRAGYQCEEEHEGLSPKEISEYWDTLAEKHRKEKEAENNVVDDNTDEQSEQVDATEETSEAKEVSEASDDSGKQVEAKSIESPNNDAYEKSIMDQIEADAFPEIGAQASSYDEPDYSNYIPPEDENDDSDYDEEEPEDKYAEYLNGDNKAKKRAEKYNKKNRNKRSNDALSEY